MRATIKDVAKKAGVSTATVSNVLTGRKAVSEELREQVNHVVKELNYRPNSIARSLKTNQSKTIGVIVPDILNPFFAEVLKSIGCEINKRDYQMVMYDSGEDAERERKLLSRLLDSEMDGIIDVTSRLGEEDFLRRIPVPLVLGDITFIPDTDNIAFIRTDNFLSGKMAAEHLIQKGYQKFVAIAGPVGTALAADHRLEGFRRGLYEHGFYEESLEVFTCKFCFDDGYRMMNHFLDTCDSEIRYGVYVSSDIMAWGAVEACKRRKIRIPEQIGIIGNDNVWCSQYIGEGLTTIENSASELGGASAKLLMEALGNGGVFRERDVILPPRLCLRRTT